MAKAYFPWKVTWGKKGENEDRFATKKEAEKAKEEFKSRTLRNGKSAYVNIRVKKV